jgi:hypothetical protein
MLVAQAPTGIGKTIGTSLYPFLKAWPGQAPHKIFFLTAETSERKLALDAPMLIKRTRPELPLRVIELVAREKELASIRTRHVMALPARLQMAFTITCRRRAMLRLNSQRRRAGQGRAACGRS